MRNREPADLFARLPGHLRSRDAAEGGPLEALMGLMGQELGVIEQDIDQLYDNWFVETCEPWALPYIAELIGARPMRDISEDQAGLLRAYIANVLQYRQAKGTAAVIEQVARDVSGWPVVAVEFFQRLATSQNLNHVRGGAVAFADVRNTDGARTSRGPFSKMAHSPAAGAPEGWSGRYNIPHLGLFIWRQSAAPLWPVQDLAPGDAGTTGGAVPAQITGAPGLMRFDPLDRDLPLVNRPAADTSVAARMSARTVPAAITRGALFEALNTGRQTGRTSDDWFETNPPFRLRLKRRDVAASKLFCCDLTVTDAGVYRRPDNAGEVLVDPVLGRLSLHPSEENAPVEVGFAHASSFDIGGGAYDRRDSMERWLPEFVVAGEAPPWAIGVSKVVGTATNDLDQGGPVVTSLREAVKRWNDDATPGARGIITVMDNASYAEALSGARLIKLPKGSKLAIVAAAWGADPIGNGASVRVPGRISPQHRRPFVKGPIVVDAADGGQDAGGTLILDGLAVGLAVRPRASGDLHHLGLYNCTLGAAGGTLGKGLDCPSGNRSASVTIHRCILGAADLRNSTGALNISRSIIGEDLSADGAPPAGLLVRAPNMDTTISASTLFGRASLRTIEAENSLLMADILLQHRQQGCVRFCYVAPGSALPRRYRCRPSAGDASGMRPVFMSTEFSHPNFARLRAATPDEISNGAEDGMEMGIGFANRDPARRANILDAMTEFAPFGLTPGLIFYDVGELS